MISERNIEDTNSQEDLEDEENEENLKEDPKEKLVVALEEIRSLKRENDELNKQEKDGDHDHDKTRKEANLFKIQVQERLLQIHNMI